MRITIGIRENVVLKENNKKGKLILTKIHLGSFLHVPNLHAFICFKKLVCSAHHGTLMKPNQEAECNTALGFNNIYGTFICGKSICSKK